MRFYTQNPNPDYFMELPPFIIFFCVLLVVFLLKVVFNFVVFFIFKLLPSSAQAKAPAGLSRIIITVGHPVNHPEKYNFQARAILGSSLASWELL